MIRSAHLESFDGTTIRYHVAGTGPQWIVIANGHGATIEVWTPVFERLPSQCRVLTWDYRGQYGSSIPPSTPTLADHCRDLDAIIDELALKHFALGGWSLGVQVALQAYRERPERVGSLVLMHGAHDRLLRRILGGRLGPLVNPASRITARVEPLLAPLAKPMIRRFLKGPMAKPSIRGLGMAYKRVEYFQEMAQAFMDLDLATYLRVACNANEHHTEEWLAQVDVPVFLTAGKLDWLTPPSQVRRAFERLPNATYQEFAGGHFPVIEEPGRVAEILARAAQVSWAETGDGDTSM